MATKKQELPPQTSDKAMAAGIGGAIATLALCLLASWFGIEPPASADVQLSIQTLIEVLVMIAVGGLVPAGAAWSKRNWQKPVDAGD